MTDQPLSDARLKEINSALGVILKARDLAAKADKCGVDVSEDLAYLDAQEANFEEWKRQFFPNKR